MKRAVIIGASTGMGREMARVLALHGYTLGLADQNINELKAVKAELPSKNAIIRYMDVTGKETSNHFKQLVKALGGVDLVLITAGIGYINPELNFEEERRTIDVNVIGFTAVAIAAFKYFAKKKKGHLAVITSIAALRGNKDSPSYGASKAYVSNYLEALRTKSFQQKLNITVTEIIPGYVRTPMLEGRKRIFWISSVEKAADAIYKALEKKKEIAYITKRWGVIAWIIKLTPSFIYKRY